MRTIFLFAYLCLLILPIVGCGTEKEVPPPPSVVLISLDTLRADALGCYGYHRDTSPVLDAFAKESVLFEQAIVQSTATPSSHAAMLTGINPTLLKVGSKFPQNELDLDPETASYGYGLIDDLTPTIQSRLREAGYRTAAFTAHDAWLGKKNGFHTGFDHFETGYPTAPENLERIDAWLQTDSQRPMFLFIHFYDVHSDFENLPYEVPAPFFGRYTSQYEGETFNLSKGDLKSSQLLQSMFKKEEKFTDREIQYIRDLYDEGVYYMDHHMKQLFDLLKKHGLYDNALVIITSDHGEEFQEHGGLLHYQYYDEILRVPLLMRFPNAQYAGLRVSPQVRCVDISQTVMDLADLAPLRMSNATSLMPLVDTLGGSGNWSGELDGSYSFDGWKAAYRTEQYKFYYRMNTESMLFDLKNDPDERNDIYNSEPDIANQLQERMKERFEHGYEMGGKLADKRKQSGRLEKDFSDDALKRLEELGYTGN